MKKHYITVLLCLLEFVFMMIKCLEKYSIIFFFSNLVFEKTENELEDSSFIGTSYLISTDRLYCIKKI